MFHPPSFLYSGIDKETIQLNNELYQLGGGNTKIFNMKLHTSIDSHLKKKDDRQVLWNYTTMIGIRDINLPRNSPITKSMKYYPMSSIQSFPFSDDNYQQPDHLFSNVVNDIINDINDGYNTSLISIGINNNMNKTKQTFGNFGINDSIESNCIISDIFNRLYTKANSDIDVITTIALSAWFIQSDQTIDLMVPKVSNDSKELLEFSSIEAPTIAIAYQLLHESRSRVPGCLPIISQTKTNESNKGHFFFRIIIHKKLKSNINNDEGSLSTLYLIDLNNIVSIDNNYFKRLSIDDQIICRNNNMQLQTLFKVLQEMRSLSSKAQINEFSPLESSLYSLDITNNNNNLKKNQPVNAINYESIMKITSARESKLTSILAPLLQGNNNTSFLLNLEDGEKHASESLNLLKAFHGICDITSACIRIKDISLNSLKLLQYSDVIGPYYSNQYNTDNIPLKNGIHPKQWNKEIELLNGQYITNNSNSLNIIHDDHTDYENIDFDSILKADFHENSLNNTDNVVTENKTKIPSPDYNQNYHKNKNEIKKVNQIMNEFHDLMEELENINQDNMINSPFKKSKQVVQNFLSSTNMNNIPINNKSYEFPNILSSIVDYPKYDDVVNYKNNDSDNDSIVCDSLQSDDHNNNIRNNEYNNNQYYNHETNNEEKYDLNISSNDYIDKPYNNTEEVQYNSNNYMNSDEYHTEYFPSNDNINDNIPFLYQDKTKTNHNLTESKVRYSKEDNIKDIYQNEYQYPDVESIGLDTSITKIPLTTYELKDEVDRLRRTNISLMNALAEEKKSKESIEHKLNFSTDDKLELKTQYELEMESLKLEIRQLKAQLRSICDNHSLTDIFATFEDNVSRLVRENETLRQMNIQLETKSYHYVESMNNTNNNITNKYSIDFTKINKSKYNHKKSALLNPNNNNNENKDNTNFSELDWIASSESYKLQTLKKENLRLLTKVKKINNDYNEIKNEYEKIKSKERYYILNNKISNDTANRLRNTYQELIKVKNELAIEKKLHEQKVKDLEMIKEDTVLVRKSESYLKEERNLILNEVAMLRERVREVDHESNRMVQLNKFINKHSQNIDNSHNNIHLNPKTHSLKQHSIVPNNLNEQQNKMERKVSLYEKIDPYRAHIANFVHNQRNKNNPSNEKLQNDENLKSIHSSVNVLQNDHQYKETPDIGIAGLSNAHYFRREEQDGINPALEVSLTAMHEALSATVPTLLPLFRKLSDDIHNERAISLKKRSDLLSRVYPKQYIKKDDKEYQLKYSNILKSNVKQ